MESKDAPSVTGLVASFLEGLPNPVFVKDESHRWVLLNAAFCTFMGRERVDLLGKIDVDFFPPAEARVFWATDDAVFAGALVSENEEQFTDSSGSTHTIITRKSLHTDEHGRRLLLGVITDITALHDERQRADESMREQLRVKTQLAKIAESVPGVIYAYRLRPDGSACMPFGARSASELFGISPDVLATDMTPFFANTHPDDIQRVNGTLVEAARTVSDWHAEFRYLHPTRGLRWLEGWSSPVAEPDGSILWHGYVTDVTERKWAAAKTEKLTEQLQQSQKLESIGRLAGGVAHDFNNLLTVVLSCAETLREELEAGEHAQPELIDEILAAGKRAAGLTRQLLAFARKQIIAPVSLDLNAVVRGSEKLLRRVLGEDVELVVALQPELWMIRCDPGQIDQAILNLAINARDAMPSGGRLVIETTNAQVDERLVASHPFMRAGPYVRLTIGDTGVGMTPEAKAHIFEPFFTTKPQGKGTGLGLATVYGIVKQSEGYILVESDAGRGTTFELYFPRTVQATVMAPEALTASRRGTESILVVEDDPQVRKIAIRSLLAGGYRVMEAGSPREALELVMRGESEIDLLLTDVVMPGFNGRELADQVRQHRPGLRVLFISGYTQDVLSRTQVLDSGVEFLSKPFTAADLQERVRRILDAGWAERLVTGIGEIDSQHRALLANVAALDEAARGGDLNQASDTLRFLAEYVSNHFAAEEEYMRSRGYPGLAEHQAIHETFVSEYVRRKTDFEANGSLVSLVQGLSDWLNGWLHEHIRGADTQMAEYLRSTPRQDGKP